MNTHALFVQYVDVVNQAIGQHRDEVPYKQLVQLGDKALGDEPFGVAVYKGDDDTPHDTFQLRLSDGTLEVVEHGLSGESIAWKVPEAHLRKVVDEPQAFIDGPEKLNLDWLWRRAGLA